MKYWAVFLMAALMLGGCGGTPPKLVYRSNVPGGAVLAGSSYAGGPRGAFSTCVSEIDGQPVGNYPDCDFLAGQKLTVSEDVHKLLIGMGIEEGASRNFVGAPVSVMLKAGETYTVQGEVLSTDRIHVSLVDSKGSRLTVMEIYLPGTRDARFAKDSGLRKAPEKHEIFLAADFGPRANKIENDFLTAFASLGSSCHVKLTTFSLPRPSAQLSLDPVSPLSEREIRRRAGSADGLLEVRMKSWSSLGGLGDDVSTPLQTGSMGLNAQLYDPAKGTLQWDASLDLKVTDRAGGASLAEALVQRFAELRIFKDCPPSVIR